MKRKTKWIFTIIAIVLFLVLGSMLSGEPLSSRAMVVGFGIDLTEDGKLEVSAQILQAGKGSDTAAMNSRVVTGTHDTIAGALGKVSEKTGLTVTLTHCNVVLLGRKTAESRDVYSVMNYLITNNYLSENAYLFATDGKAGELLNTKTGFGGNASLYIQQLIGQYGEYNDVGSRTLQQFVVDYHRPCHANWLPLITTEPVDPEISESAASDGGSSKETEYTFNVNSVMLYDQNAFIAEHGPDGMKAINYVKNKIKKGNLEAKGDNDEEIVLYILDKKTSLKYDYETLTVNIKVEIDAILKEIIDNSSDDKFVDRTAVTDTEIKTAEDNVKNVIEEFFSALQEYKLDVFGFCEGFYARFGKKAEGLCAKDMNIQVEVKVKVGNI